MEHTCGANAATKQTKARSKMKIKNDDYVMLGGAAEGEPVELTELELNLILGGYEPGYQESNPNANGWDLTGSSSGNGGDGGAGGQGGDPHFGGAEGAGGGGAGGGGGQPHNETQPYPTATPGPNDSWGNLLINSAINAASKIGEWYSPALDPTGLSFMPIPVEVLYPPRPQS